jgi:hypothetical protein
LRQQVTGNGCPVGEVLSLHPWLFISDWEMWALPSQRSWPPLVKILEHQPWEWEGGGIMFSVFLFPSLCFSDLTFSYLFFFQNFSVNVYLYFLIFSWYNFSLQHLNYHDKECLIKKTDLHLKEWGRQLR